MKTQRVIIAVLSLLVLGLAYLAFSNRKSTEESAQPNASASGPAKSVELWHTNTLERWRTNTESITNVVVQTVTNEVIKEVPAKLSAAERQAGIVGYKFIHAPGLENEADALYKLNPVTVEVVVDPATATFLGLDADGFKKKAEQVLHSKNIPIADKSPDHLKLFMGAVWRMSDPRVALFRCRLELREIAAIERQNDIIKSPSVVWSATTSKFVRTLNPTEQVDVCMQEPLNRFCDDFLSAKEREKQTESRIAKVPADFLTGGGKE